MTAAALAEGAAITGPGLHLMDTPKLSPESISSRVAGGAQMVCFTTGHGNPYGSALAPTIKLTGNPETAARLPGQIDFDASAAFVGLRSRADLLPELLALVALVCNGAFTAVERNGEGDEVISRLGRRYDGASAPDAFGRARATCSSRLYWTPFPIWRFHALGPGPVQMNRYAYLSDAKLDALGARWRLDKTLSAPSDRLAIKHQTPLRSGQGSSAAGIRSLSLLGRWENHRKAALQAWAHPNIH